ncbi:uncharacterized protein PAC_07656 [Phialocephala subalpina]|uniref:Uncharacterized protein n=1 Tax=Phialocephala subalpina TaxID=576137 RepID=A0A1L7WYC0_9HELO|nr:uncharacterized protein PAC_07656 [Phialocephala subalpina]
MLGIKVPLTISNPITGVFAISALESPKGNRRPETRRSLPAVPATPPAIDSSSPKQGDTKNSLEPHVPLSNPSGIDARITPPDTDTKGKESHHLHKFHLRSPPATDVDPRPAAADPKAEESRPVTESAAQQPASFSQGLGDEAYSLENDEDTAKLVKAYVDRLAKVLEDDNATDSSAARVELMTLVLPTTIALMDLRVAFSLFCLKGNKFSSKIITCQIL